MPLWDAFGIADSEMFSFWNPENPITTNREDVLCTCYVNDNRILVCLASWAEEKAPVKLCMKKKMHIQHIFAPDIEGKQVYQRFSEDDTLWIEKGSGLVLEVLTVM